MKFQHPWKAIQEGIKRIMNKHNIPGSIKYSGFDKYDNSDIYIVIRTKHDATDVDTILEAFRSEHVCKRVTGRIDQRNYHDEVWDPQAYTHWKTGPYDKYSFNIDVTPGTNPTNFYQQYAPVSYDDIDDVNNEKAAILRNVGFKSPDQITQSDIDTIASMDDIDFSTVSTLCSVLGLEAPRKITMRMNDSIETFSPVTSRQANKLKDAGIETIQDLDNATNEELLNITGIGNSRIWKIRNKLTDADTTPEINRY